MTTPTVPASIDAALLTDAIRSAAEATDPFPQRWATRVQGWDWLVTVHRTNRDHGHDNAWVIELYSPPDDLDAEDTP